VRDDHDHELDGAGIADDEAVRRSSPGVRVVAIVVVIAMVLSAAAVVIGILTSDDGADVEVSSAPSSVVESTVTAPANRTPQQPVTTQLSPCSPLPPHAIAEVLGVASVEVSPDGATPDGAGCAVVAAPWTVGYSMVEAVEPDPSSPLEPLPIGDRAYLSLANDRGGSWSATGLVVVGDRAVMLTVRSSARGVDTYPGDEGPAVEPQVRERSTALLEALAARL
jgi:hypothetical protein